MNGLGKIGKNKKIITPILIAIIAAVAIGTYIGIPRGPGGTVTRFYGEINDGDFEAASGYVVEEDVEEFKDTMLMGGAEEMEEAMQQIEVEGDILNEKITNGEATVEAEITMNIGSPMTGEDTEEKMQEEFELIQQDGEWKIIYM